MMMSVNFTFKIQRRESSKCVKFIKIINSLLNAIFNAYVVVLKSSSMPLQITIRCSYSNSHASFIVSFALHKDFEFSHSSFHAFPPSYTTNFRFLSKICENKLPVRWKWEWKLLATTTKTLMEFRNFSSAHTHLLRVMNSKQVRNISLLNMCEGWKAYELIWRKFYLKYFRDKRRRTLRCFWLNFHQYKIYFLSFSLSTPHKNVYQHHRTQLENEIFTQITFSKCFSFIQFCCFHKSI